MQKTMHIILFGILLSCEEKSVSDSATEQGTVAERQEGTEVGDCTDGADNDGDGDFDCIDSGCFGSPDCEEVEVDTGTETESTTNVYVY